MCTQWSRSRCVCDRYSWVLGGTLILVNCSGGGPATESPSAVSASALSSFTANSPAAVTIAAARQHSQHGGCRTKRAVVAAEATELECVDGRGKAELRHHVLVLIHTHLAVGQRNQCALRPWAGAGQVQ